MMSVSERSRSIQARSHEIMQHSTGFEHGMLELLNPNQEFGFHGTSHHLYLPFFIHLLFIQEEY